MEREQILTKEGARRIGGLLQASEDWKTAWTRDWEKLEHVVKDISRRLLMVENHLDKDDKGGLLNTLKTWSGLESEDTSLEQALDGLRARAASLPPECHGDWEAHDLLIRSQMALLNNAIDALRVKLQLLMRHPREEVERIVAAVLARKPGEETGISEEYLEQLRQATIDIEREQHEAGSFKDDLKALFLWVDTPEERLQDKSKPAHLRRPQPARAATSE